MGKSKYLFNLCWQRFTQVGVYTVAFTVALFAAYYLRFDIRNELSAHFLPWIPYNLLWILPLKLFCMALFGSYREALSYFRMPDLVKVVTSNLVASIIILYVAYSYADKELPLGVVLPTRGIVLIDFVLSIGSICSARIGLRMLRESGLRGSVDKKSARRLAIIGAGDLGARLAADYLSRPGLGKKPVVFIDDDPAKKGEYIHGILVAGGVADIAQIRNRYLIQDTVVAINHAPVTRLREIMSQVSEQGLPVEIMPSFDDFVSGAVRATRVRPVDIEDLLGREAVELDTKGIRELVRDRIVMVTGGGGSIGSELCRQIASLGAARLLVVEQCEVQLFQIEQNLIELGYRNAVVPIIGDVLDEARMRQVFERHRPQLVFHAAAHKHVPMMERQPIEAIRNNAFGTRCIADLAGEFGAERFVLISTDKAINPTNVMGATKRLAELYVQAKQGASGSGATRYMAVRFGNVLGSSGSVIPTFKRQLEQGGPLTVTHPDVTRYFMTIPEAVGLVLQCAKQGNGGEIFVLDMGKPVRIADLARQMIELSGFTPDIDIRIEFTGLCPGEKLYEELQHGGEQHQSTEHPRIMRFVSQPARIEAVRDWYASLAKDIFRKDSHALKREIQAIIPEYVPFFND